MPLSDYERRVLAAMEAELRDVSARRFRLRGATGRLLVVLGSCAIACVLAVAAVAEFPPPGAAAVTGVVGALAGVVTSVVLYRRPRPVGPRWHAVPLRNWLRHHR
jgi:hypothetical protein